AARPELPLALDRVIATAMAKSQDDRYTSCAALVQAVVGALDEKATKVGMSVLSDPGKTRADEPLAPDAGVPGATRLRDADVPAAAGTRVDGPAAVGIVAAGATVADDADTATLASRPALEDALPTQTAGASGKTVADGAD